MNRARRGDMMARDDRRGHSPRRLQPLLSHCHVDEPEISLLELNVARMPSYGLPQPAFAEDLRVGDGS